MKPSLKKRFWKEASVVQADEGYNVTLDGHPVRTPSKSALIIRYHAIAEQIAAEWMAQEEEVDPTTMPATRMVNSVIDKVSINADAIVEMLAEYAGTDLLCYRATTPQSLITEQARVWDPLLQWSADTMNAPLNSTSGVMFAAQDDASVDIYRYRLRELNHYQLAGVHDLITISGSMVISMALISNHISLDQAWIAATIDEAWQEKQWGADDEAQETLSKKRADFEFAYGFWKNASIVH
jgi:chaperone required for assembly of F1-ATPase